MSRVAFTGVAYLSGVKVARENLERLAEQHCHTVVTDPSRMWEVEFLVTNDPNTTTKKAKRALAYGTKIITPDQFVAMCGGQIELRDKDLFS